MQNAETIYQQNISPLPKREKLRLATIILQDLRGEESPSQSALDLLQNLSGERVFDSPQKVDEHLKAERESWDN